MNKCMLYAICPWKEGDEDKETAHAFSFSEEKELSSVSHEKSKRFLSNVGYFAKTVGTSHVYAEERGFYTMASFQVRKEGYGKSFSLVFPLCKIIEMIQDDEEQTCTFSVYQDGNETIYGVDIRENENQKDTYNIFVGVPVRNSFVTVQSDTCKISYEEIDRIFRIASMHTFPVNLWEERVRDIWTDIVTAYKKHIECGTFGLTMNPKRTILATIQEKTGGISTSFSEIRAVFALVAMARPWDNRISQENRVWLEEVQKAQETFADTWTVNQWKPYEPNLDKKWIKTMGNLDEIHPAHLDNLITAMRLFATERRKTNEF